MIILFPEFIKLNKVPLRKRTGIISNHWVSLGKAETEKVNGSSVTNYFASQAIYNSLLLNDILELLSDKILNISFDG